MPNSPQPQHQDRAAVTDTDLAALLAGEVAVAPGLRPVADILAALAAEATAGELAGEARALAAYRRRTGAPAARRAVRRAPARRRPRFGAKVAAAATAAAVILGGAASAAFANVLPAPIQRFAHETIGAPIPPLRPDLLSHGSSAGHGRRTHGDHTAHGNGAARGSHAQGRGSHGQGSQGAGNRGGPHGTGTQRSQGQQSARQTQSGNRDPVGLSGSPQTQRQGARPHTTALLVPYPGGPAPWNTDVRT